MMLMEKKMDLMIAFLIGVVVGAVYILFEACRYKSDLRRILRR